MSDKIKVKEDVLRSADKLLEEILELVEQVRIARENLAPFNEEKKKAFGSLPRYVAHTKTGLESACISNFGVNYPTMEVVIQNGDATDDGMFRFHDGIFKLSKLNNALKEAKYIIKLNEERAKLTQLANEVIADFCIFLLIQYRLADSVPFLSVQNYCVKKGITASVLYGQVLNILEETGEKPYAYEAISPYRDDMLDIDANFLTECEEVRFPLTEEMAKKILAGEMSMAEANAALLEFLREREEETIEDVTPQNMLQKMQLD